MCTAEELPSACDDGPFGKGAGGQLRYRVTVGARDSETLWVAVMGSDKGPREARAELRAALRDPDRELAAKIRARERWGALTRLSLPGDRRLQQAVDWGKQNLLDLTRYSEDLQIRWLDQGREYTAPLGTVDSARWVGAGYPDYPWMFATDAEYTAFASVTMGQFEQIKDHMLDLREVSEILNNGSGIVTHEVISEGSNWFGQDSRNPTTGAYNFNTDETVKFPSAVALIWRWTGDDRFRRELYDFSVRGMRAVVDRLDEDDDGWPEGSGNVERGRHGRREARQLGVPDPRPLRPGRPGARRGRPQHARVGDRPRPPAAPAVRGRLVVPGLARRRRSTRTRSTTRRSAATTTSSRTSTGSA